MRWLAVPEESREAFARDVPAAAVRAILIVLLASVGAQLVQALGGGHAHVAAVRASASAGLLLSLLHVALGRGRSPLRMVFWPEVVSRLLLVGLGVAVSTFGTEHEATTFTVVVVLSHAAAALSVPFMSTVYGLTYPAKHRARLLSYSRMVHGIAAVTAGWVLGRLFTLEPDSYRIVYPAVGLAGLVMSVYYVRMRVPGARRAEPQGGPSSWRVLRDDVPFFRFQLFQFILGFANLGAIPVIDLFVRQELELPIDLAVLVVSHGVIVQAVTLLTVRYQGGLFDRLGVVRHRVLTSVLLGFALVTWAFGEGLPAAALAALLTGLGMAGGQLIWLIGSHAFAPPEQLSTYNGIHAFLTGLRGVTAPWVGVWLLQSPLVDGDFRVFFLGAAAIVFLSALGHGFLVKLPPPPEDAAA